MHFWGENYAGIMGTFITPSEKYINHINEGVTGKFSYYLLFNGL